ncbi:MAG: hypothetical protein AAGA03_05985 [Planctomycetota bacterium]
MSFFNLVILHVSAIGGVLLLFCVLGTLSIYVADRVRWLRVPADSAPRQEPEPILAESSTPVRLDFPGRTRHPHPYWRLSSVDLFAGASHS